MQLPYTGSSHVVNSADIRAPQTLWPSAVIFDFDGLLADTASRWLAAYERCLVRRGRGRELAARAAGLAGASVADAADALQLPRDELAAALTEAFTEHPISEMPGATRLVRSLRPSVRLAIATNGPHDLVALGLHQIGLGDCFEVIVSGEAVGSFKPAPDVYLAAARALDADASDCVAIEDSPVGAQAADRAGLIVIYIPSAGSHQAVWDLRARRLDDPQVLRYLGVTVSASAAAMSPRSRRPITG